ncbi:hypothetical protein [Mesonia aestuariivivens]|uniref:DUF4375 domain-containing protein n=1 Tax=Mesonia aestuariivivens TaxID=2796128 RepID=A0ABS6W2K6_9FLAO|nr:hypothetical protein [Mesonia aestuariivivens]MBW2961954.1 hypothetical protein [Mesonia aestuariivivens]
MFNYTDVEDFMENRDLHEDYYTLMEEYTGTSIYKEIIHFMYLAFPNWTSNRGIGSMAAEFVLSNIENLEYLDEDAINSKESLETIYLELVKRYHSFKKTFDFSDYTRLNNEFEQEYEEELQDIEHLNIEDSEKARDELYMKFEKEYLSKVTYNFIDEDELIIS